jgi:hypothetical protein
MRGDRLPFPSRPLMRGIVECAGNSVRGPHVRPIAAQADQRFLAFRDLGGRRGPAGCGRKNPAARDNGPARPAKEADGFPPRIGEATRSRPLGRQAVRAREETRPCCFP